MKPLPISHQTKDLSLIQGIYYSLPTLVVYFLYGPITVVQGIYAKYFGLTLSTIASVILLARLFDAITDPIIGYLSDRYYQKKRTRKPFVVAGCIAIIVSSWFLYVPPSNVSPQYFLIWLMLFYLSYTLFEIPHLAWGSELSESSNDKSRIYTIRTALMFLGSLIFFAMPLLPVFETSEITPQTLKWSIITAGLFIPIILYVCSFMVPNESLKLKNKNSKTPRFSQNKKFKLILKNTLRNPPLLVLTAAHICTGLGSGMWFGMLFIFVDSYLDLGEKFPIIFISSFGFSLLTLTGWLKLSQIKGKKFVWVVGMVLVLVGLLGIGLLTPDIADPTSIILCMILVYAGFAAFNIMVPSLISDIVDYGNWKFNVDQGGVYFSIYLLINKTMYALGGGVALAIAGCSGFDPTLTNHSDNAISGARFAIAWIPMCFICLSIFLIQRIPINARRHSIILRRTIARPYKSKLKIRKPVVDTPNH